MAARSYKKYMKKNATKDYTLLKMFIISFCAMFLIFTFIIKSCSPSVDVSIGDYKQESDFDTTDESEKNVDGRLSMIQEEDRGKDFSELMKKSEDFVANEQPKEISQQTVAEREPEVQTVQESEPVFKVFIGTYTSADQAKIAKDIIAETGMNLNPIVKCIGSNNYTLQVGIFKNKSSADALLNQIRQNYLPGRIVQDY